MAEVRLDVVMEFDAEGALGPLDSALARERALDVDVEAAMGAVEALADAVGRVDLSGEYALDASAAYEAIDDVTLALGSLDLERALGLDVAEALAGAEGVRAALDGIPDVTYKSVIVKYYTEASPVREFTEGMRYIKERMESLPQGTTHTVRYEGLDHASPSPSGGGQAQGAAQGFTANITVSAGGGNASGDARRLAERLDRELADMWRYNRSELRRVARS